MPFDPTPGLAFLGALTGVLGFLNAYFSYRAGRMLHKQHHQLHANADTLEQQDIVLAHQTQQLGRVEIMVNGRMDQVLRLLNEALTRIGVLEEEKRASSLPGVLPALPEKEAV